MADTNMPHVSEQGRGDKELTTLRLNLREQFAEFLKKKMYRNTQERYKVLDRIAALDKHFNADELYIHMSLLGDRISRATIYSTLDLLTACGILVKHTFQGDSAHYELTSRKPHHDHLICTECKRIVEFNLDSMREIQTAVASTYGLNALSHSLQIFGVCDDPMHCEHKQHSPAV
ncbi:MAG: transcriptional repressor [Candidatus Kapabacteria bacterium]|nr:transcriptional repressor [Candidatus Kapabacteria bacterium]